MELKLGIMLLLNRQKKMDDRTTAFGNLSIEQQQMALEAPEKPLRPGLKSKWRP